MKKLKIFLFSVLYVYELGHNQIVLWVLLGHFIVWNVANSRHELLKAMRSL
jgi:hypothetical protein